jgi:hypothetical protein
VTYRKAREREVGQRFSEAAIQGSNTAPCTFLNADMASVSHSECEDVEEKSLIGNSMAYPEALAPLCVQRKRDRTNLIRLQPIEIW